jgi:hypothetical protein
MASDIPEHHSGGSMSTEVDAPEGKRYEVRVWAMSESWLESTPVRALRGVALSSVPNCRLVRR